MNASGRRELVVAGIVLAGAVGAGWFLFSWAEDAGEGSSALRRTAVEDPAEGPAPPAPSREAPGMRAVTVSSWPSGEPVAGARVSFQDGDGEDVALGFTGGDGVALLEDVEPSRIAVTAESYVARTVEAGVVSRGAIALAPAGALVLEFADESGAAVEGVQVTLVPPAAAGELIAQGLWSVRDLGRPSSDAAGQVRWDALPALEGYRWQCLSRLALDLVPAYEVPEFEPLAQGFRQNSVPRDRSGVFAIEHRRETRLRCPVFRTTTIEGTLVCGPLPEDPRPEVVLFHEQVIPNAAGNTLTFFAQEAAVEVDAAAEFRFPGVRPGRKRLSSALDRGHDWYFAREDLEIAPGERRRVQLRVPEPEEGIELRVVFVDAAGAPVAPASAVRAVPAGDPAPAILGTLFNVQVSAPGHSSFVVQLPREGSMSLHGLDEGLWQVQMSRSAIQEVLREDFQVEETFVYRRFAVPAEQPVEVEVTLRRSLPLRGLVRYPPGVEAFDFWVEFLERDTGRVSRVNVFAAELAEDSSFPLDLPAGAYELLARPMDGSGASGRFSGGGSVRLDPGSSAPVVVEFREGVTLRGKLVDGSGAPLAGAAFWLTPEAWVRPDRVQWLHGATSDARGEFSVPGLAPLSAYLVQGPPGTAVRPDRLRTGGGGEQAVEFVVE